MVILKKLRWIMLATVTLGLLFTVTLPALAGYVINADGTVTFSLTAPANTSTVTVTYSATPSTEPVGTMVKGANDVWSFTTPEVLVPDWYRYYFRVDGMKVPDPSNNTMLYSTWGAGTLWQFFMVPGPAADFLATKDVPHGRVSTVWYHSSVTNDWRSMAVYTPPGYVHDTRKYPVLYLHHGANNDGFQWIWSLRADFILDNLFAEGKAVPMIVVMPAHHGIPRNSDPALDIYVVQELLGNIIPTIEKQFRVLPGSANRAIAGLSMGGGRTLEALLQVPKAFDYFCPLSMGWTAENIATIEQNHRDLLLDLAANRNIKLLWISMGRDDPLLARIPGTLALLDKYDVDYTYVEVPGAHQPHVWRDQLYQFAPLLFREHGRSPR
jgi:enterochelin esterase-like enzyme